jgi:hypothetical protein
MKKLLPFTLLLLSGCFATSEPMYLPDGSQGYRISCEHYMGTTADCLQKAGDLCGAQGYITYDQNGRVKSEESQNQTVIAAVNNTTTNTAARSVKVSPPDARNIFIKCRSNDMPLHLTPAANPAPVQSLMTPMPPPTLTATPMAMPTLSVTPTPLHNNK